MLLIDAFFRFSGVGLMLFMCALSLRDLNKSTSSVYFILTFLTLSFYFLGFVPEQYHMPYYFKLGFRLLDAPFLVFTWLFILSLFKKDFKLTPIYVIIGVVYSFFILMERLVQFRFIDHLPLWWAWVVNLSSIALVLHLLIITMTERNDDLIEKRRQSRVYLVYITAIMTITITSFSFYLLNHQNYAYLQPTINIIAIWLIIVLTSFWLLHMKANSFAFDAAKVDETKLNARDAELKKEKAHIPILTIALNHGFNSLSTFNRAFKLAETVTPSEFRKIGNDL